MNNPRSLRAGILCAAGAAAFLFCEDTRAQVMRGPAIQAEADAGQIAPAAEFVRRSPLRIKEGAVPAPVQAIGGAVLSVDAAAMESLREVAAVQLTDFVLEPGLTVGLDLRQSDIFADDALVLASQFGPGGVESEPVAIPEMTILVGRTMDDPDSVVALSFSEHGIQGFVNRLGETFVLSSGLARNQGEPVIYKLDETSVEALGLTGFECGADLIPQPNAPAIGGVAGGDVGNGEPPCRIVRVAIETDHEFLSNLFDGNFSAAMAYTATLLAGSSEVFQRDVNVRFQIVFIQLWPSASDPWDAGNTSGQLNQFGDYWDENNEWIERDIAHFLSGRVLGGGIAWLNALCAEGIEYSVSANLTGTFPYPTQMQSDFNWDIIVVTHELGHNFGSPHTHNYDPVIDGCGLGDCSNASNGTIMSYCHQCPGGLSNTNIRFHEVVIDRILEYLENETLCDLLDTTGPPDPNNDFEFVAAGVGTPIDVLRNDLSGNCNAPDIISHDAATAMGGAVALSLGTGPDGRDQLLYSPPAGFTGEDQFFYTITNGSGTNASGQVKVNVLPVRQAENTACTEPGLYVGYYQLSNPSSMPDFDTLAPYAGQIVSQINYESTNGDFAGSGQDNNVGAVFIGYLDVPVTAAYHMSTISDDGSLLYLGDEVIVNNDGLHGMVDVTEVRALEAGLHELRVEFFENGGGAGLQFVISGAGVFKQAVPASMLRRGGALLADFVTSATFQPPGDGSVDGADLAYMLGEWGDNAGSLADIVSSETFLPPSDGTVNGADLAYLLGGWGGCD